MHYSHQNKTDLSREQIIVYIKNTLLVDNWVIFCLIV